MRRWGRATNATASPDEPLRPRRSASASPVEPFRGHPIDSAGVDEPLRAHPKVSSDPDQPVRAHPIDSPDIDEPLGGRRNVSACPNQPRRGHPNGSAGFHQARTTDPGNGGGSNEARKALFHFARAVREASKAQSSRAPNPKSSAIGTNTGTAGVPPALMPSLSRLRSHRGSVTMR